MKKNNYDVIVVGVGSMGSATCYELALKGYSVLGLEQFDSPHEHGAHSGQSRIIRKAYFEHPDYIPLLERAYANWQKLEEVTGSQFYYRTGLLYIGQAYHPVIKGVKQAASAFQIPVNETPEHQFNYSQFNFKDDQKAIFELDAGFILPEKAIAAYKRLAIMNGADIRSNEVVLNWEKTDGSIRVTTNKNTYSSAKLIITAGAWMKKLVSHLSIHLKITRQFLIWIKPTNTALYSSPSFPCWMIAASNGEGVYYGFPYLNDPAIGGPEGLKFGWHYPGEETDPGNVNREVTKDEIAMVVNELSRYLPVVNSPVVAVKTCLYSNSPDENFIIDQLPGYDGDVIIAGGFSGHGFKFVSVIGEILSDLAIKGKTELPIDFLSLKRLLQ